MGKKKHNEKKGLACLGDLKNIPVEKLQSVFSDESTFPFMVCEPRMGDDWYYIKMEDQEFRTPKCMVGILCELLSRTMEDGDAHAANVRYNVDRELYGVTKKDKARLAEERETFALKHNRNDAFTKRFLREVSRFVIRHCKVQTTTREDPRLREVEQHVRRRREEKDATPKSREEEVDPEVDDCIVEVE